MEMLFGKKFRFCGEKKTKTVQMDEYFAKSVENAFQYGLRFCAKGKKVPKKNKKE